MWSDPVAKTSTWLELTWNRKWSNLYMCPCLRDYNLIVSAAALDWLHSVGQNVFNCCRVLLFTPQLCCRNHLGLYSTGNASILAAKIKSNIDNPPIACVANTTCTHMKISTAGTMHLSRCICQYLHLPVLDQVQIRVMTLLLCYLGNLIKELDGCSTQHLSAGRGTTCNVVRTCCILYLQQSFWQ